MKPTLFLPGAVAALIFFPILLSAQYLDLRSQRLVLDDDAADGGGNTVTVQTSNPLAQNTILTIPDPGTAGASFLLSESSSPQIVNADISFAGTITFSSGGPAFSLVAEQLLFGDPGGSGGMAQSADLLWDDGGKVLEINGDLDLNGGELLNAGGIVAPLTLDLRSNGSIVVNIDDDNNGSGSSFAVEANGAAADLFSVTETGFATIASASSTGGLRVVNTNGIGTANVLELTDGTTSLMTVRRNGNAGIGTVPGARLDVANTSVGESAVRIRNTHTGGVGLELADGALVAEVQAVGGGGTIGDDAVIVEATGGTLSVPSGGVDGQMLYVVNTTAGGITLNGLATDGTDTGMTIPQGGATTLVRVGGAWYAVDRN